MAHLEYVKYRNDIKVSSKNSYIQEADINVKVNVHIINGLIIPEIKRAGKNSSYIDGEQFCGQRLPNQAL